MNEVEKEKLDWECEGCKLRFAEYVNGCPKCWDDTLSIEENQKKYPSRKVVFKEEGEMNNGIN